MKALWAPWRMEYILGDKETAGCFFCPGGDRSTDEERLILALGPQTMVLMNRFPYNNGHLLVAPLRHVGRLEQLTPEETGAIMAAVQQSIRILQTVMRPEGFNVGLNLGKAAGAGVDEHLHVHIVPRWNGDTNFMGVVGEVRVIPEHIRATYHKLLPYYRDSNMETGGSL